MYLHVPFVYPLHIQEQQKEWSGLGRMIRLIMMSERGVEEIEAA